MSYGSSQNSRSPRRSPDRFAGLKIRLLIGAVIVLFSLVNYWMTGQVNPVTGKTQRVGMSVEQEIALGRQSAPSMGMTSLNRFAVTRVETIGYRLVDALKNHLAKSGQQLPYPFDFHLLANEGKNRDLVNAFALPGGQVFITEALYRRLSQTRDDELAGVLGHEIGHVIERHGAERMAHAGMLEGLANAAGVAGGSQGSSRAAAMVAEMVSRRYGQGDELESDHWGVRLMFLAEYDPNGLLRVMDVLEEAGGGGGSSFMSTHPITADRKAFIENIIRQERQKASDELTPVFFDD